VLENFLILEQDELEFIQIFFFNQNLKLKGVHGLNIKFKKFYAECSNIVTSNSFFRVLQI
jgi:hypothetical protein